VDRAGRVCGFAAIDRGGCGYCGMAAAEARVSERPGRLTRIDWRGQKISL
jgi:hypothetical protein